MPNLALTSPEPAVSIENGRIVTTSADVARRFGKRHDHVMRDIAGIIAGAPACLPNFGETSITRKMPNGGHRMTRAYTMDRDGFTLLAMGFTGKAALEWKIKYIHAFNAMEAKLRDDAFPMDGEMFVALQARLASLEKRVDSVPQLVAAHMKSHRNASTAPKARAALPLTSPIQSEAIRKLFLKHGEARAEFIRLIDKMKFDKAHAAADAAEAKAANAILSYPCSTQQEWRDKANYIATNPSFGKSGSDMQPKQIALLLKSMAN